MVKTPEQKRREGAERKQRWRERHPEAARARTRADNDRWRANHPGWHKAYQVPGSRPPPLSKCPPRPADGRCQVCHEPTTRFDRHHNHETGEFIAWTCRRCNVRLNKHMGEFGEPWRRGPLTAEHRAKIAAAKRR